MNRKEAKEEEFIPFHKVAIEILKGMIDEHPILLEDVESVYYFYGPRKVKAPREACEELIKLMNKVMSKYRLEMPVHIHTYHFQACENLRRQLNLKKD